MFVPIKPRFNSDASCKLLDLLHDAQANEIQRRNAGTSSRTFSPSGLRCSRRQWFRLRGSEPDTIENPDIGMEYRASIGTARHVIIQNLLEKHLGVCWIPVETWLQRNPIPYKYELEPRTDTNETLVRILDIPIKFACDGIIRIGDKVYLLEIKTCEAGALDKLNGPKPVHVDQIKAYAALLGIHDVLVLYEDRTNGATKCFEVNFTDVDFKFVIDQMKYIMDMAEKQIAPPRLPYGDYMCSNCPYQKKCKEW